MSITKPDLSQPITKNDWTDLVTYYKEKLDDIHIPEDPKPFDITQLNAKLEQLYHEARMDYLYTARSFDNVENAYRKLKRALYPVAKQGKNAEEREHFLQDYLMKNNLDQIDPIIRQALALPNQPVTIYVVYELFKDRVEFMQAVMDLIKDKTSRLITDSGAMKIESTLNK